ncbi:uncharacterized protein DS421_18g633450 [Arachis hypogaea]|nr:uncharacterized protein DS421_18g633450 [Arachis hypogaea]
MAIENFRNLAMSITVSLVYVHTNCQLNSIFPNSLTLTPYPLSFPKRNNHTESTERDLREEEEEDALLVAPHPAAFSPPSRLHRTASPSCLAFVAANPPPLLPGPVAITVAGRKEGKQKWGKRGKKELLMEEEEKREGGAVPCCRRRNATAPLPPFHGVTVVVILAGYLCMRRPRRPVHGAEPAMPSFIRILSLPLQGSVAVANEEDAASSVALGRCRAHRHSSITIELEEKRH